MATSIDKSVEVSVPLLWSEFLQNARVGAESAVQLALLSPSGNGIAIATPQLRFYCEGDSCQNEMFCFCLSQLGHPTNNNGMHSLAYHCRNCGVLVKTISVAFPSPQEFYLGRNIRVIKIGECPLPSLRVPARVHRLVQEDRDLLIKGLRAESQGLGIGAFSYYRRVIERHKDALFDAIIKVANRVGSDPSLISNLQSAKKEVQFSKAVEVMKDGIPESLKISGHNPLSLLHTATSRGLHSQSDEECLELAKDIRLVLVEFAENIASVLKDHVELDNALSRLMNPQKKQ